MASVLHCRSTDLTPNSPMLETTRGSVHPAVVSCTCCGFGPQARGALSRRHAGVKSRATWGSFVPTWLLESGYSQHQAELASPAACFTRLAVPSTEPAGIVGAELLLSLTLLPRAVLAGCTSQKVFAARRSWFCSLKFQPCGDLCLALPDLLGAMYRLVCAALWT